MLDKKSFVSLVVMVGYSGLAHANSFNGKNMGMADAGVATSSHLEGMSLNPAALANFADGQDFNLHINAGLLGSDKDDLIDDAEDLSDIFNDLDGAQITVEQAEDIIGRLQQLDGKAALIQAGGGIYMSIPMQAVSIGLFAKTSLDVGAVALVSDGDLARIEQVYEDGLAFDSDDLHSSVVALGTALTEAGVNIARKSGPFAYGLTLKHQQVDVIEYVSTLDGFDKDDFDADEYSTDDNGFNADLGVQYGYGNWRAGGKISNLVEATYKSVSGREISIEPRLTLGGGFRNQWLTAALDVDANATPNMITGDDSQFVSVGVEMDAWGWAQLRLGYKTDIKSMLEDTASVGLGFSPWGVVNLDLSVMAGDNDTIGAAVQFGLAF